MRSSISLSLLATFHSVVSFTNAAPQHIQQRSSYSVVPVDGGAAAAAQSGGSPAPLTIIVTKMETVTEKSPAATITIVEHQPKLETSEITKTVTVTALTASESGEEKQEDERKKDNEIVTLTVTEEHVPTAINTEGRGPLIYLPTTVVETHFVTLPRETIWLVGSMAATSDASLFSASRAITSSSRPSTTVSSASTMETTASSTSTTSRSNGDPTSTSSSMLLITSLPPYDNGQWRTTYPVWSNSTPTIAP